MNLSDPSHIDVLVDEVKTWSSSDRIRLARKIVETLDPAVPQVPARSLKDGLGILKTSDPPPSDEECQAILAEGLARKHLR